MAWKCEICKDRGAVMGLNHPTVCECQTQNQQLVLDCPYLTANFGTNRMKLEVKKQPPDGLDPEAWIENYVKPLENKIFKMIMTENSTAYEVEFRQV